MSVTDWTVLALYAVAVVAIALLTRHRLAKRPRTAAVPAADAPEATDAGGVPANESYFVGGRDLPWWAAGISLLATSFSAAALISGAQFGYRRGMGWLQLQLGDVLAVAVVCALFLPFFSRLRVTTAYEYVGRRFGAIARRTASALFVVQTLARVAVLVYAPALAVAALVGIDVDTCIIAVAAVAVVYSVLGGLAAVVWTDCLQMVVVVLGVGAAFAVMASDVDGGLGTLLVHARDAGRLECIAWPEEGRFFKDLFTVPGAVLAYGVLAMSMFGTGQQQVQRYAACRDLRAARRAAFVAPLAGTLVLGLCLLLGATLASWSEITGTALIDGDDVKVLPAFVAGHLPAGLRGLLLAAIVAAAMSSIDSAVHSMSTAVIVDFYRPLRGRASAPNTASELRLARILTAMFGVAAVAGAMLAGQGDATLLDKLVTWLGYPAGPLLGLFLLGMLTRSVGEVAALAGVAAGVELVVLAVGLDLPVRWGFHPLWLCPAACVVTVLVGLLLGRVCRRPTDAVVRELTVRTPR